MQAAAAIGLHSPGKLYKRNRGLKKMGKKKLRHYAETPTRGLPQRASKGDYDKAFAG